MKRHKGLGKICKICKKQRWKLALLYHSVLAVNRPGGSNGSATSGHRNNDNRPTVSRHTFILFSRKQFRSKHFILVLPSGWKFKHNVPR